MQYEKYQMPETSHVFRISVDISDDITVNRVWEIVDNSNVKDCQNNIPSRELSWRKYFGDTPMPTPKPDTVRTAAGTLGQGMGITDEDIEDAISEME